MIGQDGFINADTPNFTLDTLTDVQLREYRRELEHSLKVIAPGAPVRGLLASKLFEVMGEQASRSGPEPVGSELLDDPALNNSGLRDGEIVSNS